MRRVPQNSGCWLWRQGDQARGSLGLASARFTIPLSVTAAIVWIGLFCIWILWEFCTFRVVQISPTELHWLITREQHGIVTTCNVGFLAWFALGALDVVRDPPDLRRAHTGGLIFATLLMCLVQVATNRALVPPGFEDADPSRYPTHEEWTDPDWWRRAQDE